MTYKVFDASSGLWELCESESGPDLADMIMIWQKKTGAQIKKAEPPSSNPVRDGDAKYRVFLTTFVYYTPAAEGTNDPFTEDTDGPVG
jgi:hypothetical protein